MANLMQQIKVNSQLGSTSAEELQNLSNASGRAIQPVSPQEAAAVGGSADSAKMAGSSANKLSALRASIRSTMDLGTQQREQGPRQQATDTEKQNIDAGKLLGQFTGGLDERVQHLVNQKLVAASGQALESGLKVSDSAVSGVQSDHQDAVKALLTKVGNNSASSADILQLNNLLGKTQVGQELTAEQIKSNYLTGTQQIGEALAAGTAGVVKVADLDLDSLGLGSKADIANSLGVSAEALDGMTAEQMLQQINKANYEQHKQTATLQAQASSPLLGAAERAQARQALRNASGVGVRAEEAGLVDLQDQVDSAETVTVGNQAMPVGQLLSNDGLKGLVANYLSDPATAEALKASSPELADWIDHNKDALGKLTAGVDQEAKDFASIQQSNMDMAKVPDTGQTMSAGLAKQVINGYGTLSATRAEQPALVQALHDTRIPSDQRAGIVGGLEQLYKIDPTLTAEVKNFSLDDLSRLGLTTSNGMANYVSYVQGMKALDAVSSPDAVLANLGVSSAGISAEIKEIRRMQALGLAEYNTGLIDVIDPSGTGTVGNDGLKDRVSGYLGGTKTLQQMLTTGTKATDVSNPATAGQALQQPNIKNQQAYATMKSALSDGDFTSSEAIQLRDGAGGGKNNPDTVFMSDILDRVKAAAAKGLITGDGVRELETQATWAAHDKVDTDIKSRGSQGIGYIENIQNTVNKNSGYIPSDQESNDLKYMLVQIQQVPDTDKLTSSYKNSILQPLQRLIKQTDANRANKIATEAAEQKKVTETKAQAQGDESSQYWFRKKAPLGATYKSYNAKTGEITYTDVNGKDKTIVHPSNSEQQVDWR